MKRAKLMLSAIAVVAVVGGALAFTSNNKVGSFVWEATAQDEPATIKVLNSTTLPQVGAATTTGFYTAVQNAIVTTTTTIYFKN
ncbi:MAG: hypothetical protein ABI675_02880 [Chitinophagaceae bacterium]